jgi:hypothetical protein
MFLAPPVSSGGHGAYEPSDALPWLPEKVREVYDRGQKPIKKLRQHHVFVRTPSDERFIYAGPAHLGSYVSVPGNDATELSADFSLNERLPREAWLKFGGYPGWLLEIQSPEALCRCRRSGDLRATGRRTGTAEILAPLHNPLRGGTIAWAVRRGKPKPQGEAINARPRQCRCTTPRTRRK